MISIKMRAAGPGLTAKLSLDGHVFFHGEIGQESQIIDHVFNDDEEINHVLEISLSGKLPEHTTIDEQGNIVEDRRLVIEDIGLNEISLGQLTYDLAEYHHDFNGNGPKTQDKFYGEMGCNGTVRLEFTSPVYVWLLEHL